MTTQSANQDVIAQLMADHREVERKFAALEKGVAVDTVDHRVRRGLVDEVIAVLAAHALAEERFLYPAMREFLDDGAETAGRQIAVHADADAMMANLGAATPVDADFETTLTALMAAVREHIADEEDTTFPQLTASCTASRLDDLGRRMAEAKKVEAIRSARRRPVARRR